MKWNDDADYEQHQNIHRSRRLSGVDDSLVAHSVTLVQELDSHSCLRCRGFSPDKGVADLPWAPGVTYLRDALVNVGHLTLTGGTSSLVGILVSWPWTFCRLALVVIGIAHASDREDGLLRCLFQEWASSDAAKSKPIVHVVERRSWTICAQQWTREDLKRLQMQFAKAAATCRPNWENRRCWRKFLIGNGLTI